MSKILDTHFSNNISPNSLRGFQDKIGYINAINLPLVKSLFEGYTTNPNPEVVDAAVLIIGRIDNIMSLRGNISGEIMRAANDDNYSQAA